MTEPFTRDELRQLRPFLIAVSVPAIVMFTSLILVVLGLVGVLPVNLSRPVFYLFLGSSLLFVLASKLLHRNRPRLTQAALDKLDPPSTSQ
jgi:hypothetical protein